MNKILPVLFLLLITAFPLLAEDGDFENVEEISTLCFWDTAKEIIVDGSFLYVITYESGVRVLDYEDPANPEEIAICKSRGAINARIEDESIFIIRDSGFLDVYDISDPYHPQLISTTFTTNYPIRIAIYNDFLYVSVNRGDVYIYDISDLLQIQNLGIFEEDFIHFYDMAIQENVLALACHSSETDSAFVRLYDLTSPTAPALLEQIEANDMISDIRFSDDKILVEGRSLLDSQNGISIFDISDLTDIQLYSWIEIPGYIISSFLNDETLYVIRSTDGLSVYDISNPLNPSLLNNFHQEYEFSDLNMIENHLILADPDSGIKAINLLDQENMSIISSIGNIGEINKMFIHNDIAYLAGKWHTLYSVDISDPYHPEILFEISLSTSFGSVTDMAFNDDFAFVTTEDSGLHVLRITVPSFITDVYSTTDYGIQHSIAISGDYVFIGDESYGLQIYNISDPFAPTLRYGSDLCTFDDILISGEVMYFTNGRSDIFMADISDPTSPVFFDEVIYHSTYLDMKRLNMCQGQNSHGQDLLLTVTGSNVCPLVFLQSDGSYDSDIELNTPGFSADIIGDGDYLFAASEENGLKIFNYADLENIQEVGYYDCYFNTTSLALNEDYIILGDFYTLVILDCGEALGVEDSETNSTPEKFSISKAYPNPFNPTLNVEVALPVSGELNVSVYNIQGQLVGILANGVVAEGTQQMSFDGRGLSSGVYFIRAELPGYAVQTQKVVLMK